MPKRSFQRGGGWGDGKTACRLLHAPELPKPSILSTQKGAKVRLPCSKDDNFIVGVFMTFQLSKGTTFEMSHRVLTVFSQYKLAFRNMIA